MQIVTITTATTLSSSQLTKVKTLVDKKMNLKDSEVKYEKVIDPTIVGGIKLTAGSKEIDASVKAKLVKIKSELLSGI